MQLTNAKVKTKHRTLANENDFVVFEKRSGQRTHKVSPTQLGLVEVLSHHLNEELFVVHRLDKETSGLILFAKNKKMAQDFTVLFESHQIQKKYLFLTDGDLKKTEFSVKTYIEKTEKTYINNPNKEFNSETDFKFIKKISEKINLWEALPKTGKPHQIRLHAELSGIPILGDHLHGGSPFFRMALHAFELSFDLEQKKYHYQSAAPLCFTKPTQNLGDFVESEFENLKKQIELEKNQTYRIYHRGLNEDEIRIDLYGTVVWVYWYKKASPTEADISSLDQFCKKNDFIYVVRHMIDRGGGVGGLEHKDLYYTDCPEKWVALEHKIQIELRRDQGFSPGLFLDQRSNRSWIFDNSKNKSVLNLFSYTSVFSVAAAIGGASQITTVDASSAFLNWSKDNFKLNDINPERHEFFAQDSLLFLKGALKKNRKWDIIICDPPSFGRTKTTTWKIDKNLPELIQLMESCLSSKGVILFTCNYEKWTTEDIKKVFRQSLKNKKVTFLDLPMPDLDFEFPDSFDNLMKGVIVQIG